MAGESPELQRQRLRIARLVAPCVIACLLLLGLASTAQAAPEITLDKRAPASVLFGDSSAVTLHVANPPEEEYGYNLSLRDVLPEGVSYVEGSAPVEPTRIPEAPEAGKTTLLFENVSDLSGGSSYELEYEVSHDTGLLGVGDTYTNEAGAYINDDPRFVPDFGPDGTPSGDFTGEATDSAETEISAIEIVKHEPSPEGEILRGAHDHQTVYTLTVRNNAIEPTTGVQVEDWLPAGLEFLGCGETDNTTAAPTGEGSEEYAGSGPLNPGNAPATTDCVAPSLVETVETDLDGEGPLANGVYTHVVWSGLGEVEAKGQIQLQYVAAVPLRENTTSWPGEAPAPAGGTQASNLDNNSGDETFDEQPLSNLATVEGQYEGNTVDDSDALTRSAEDLAVRKTVDQPGIAHGQISTWSLLVSSSEYRYVQDIRVDDTLPDGLCPLGVENYENEANQTEECDPTGEAGGEPTHEYSSVTENADGSYAIVWNESTVPELEEVGPSSTLAISFPTRTRADYQENFEADEPVLAQDSWVNAVSIAGADYRICAPADPLCTEGGTKIDGDEEDGTDDTDASSAEQQAEPLAIDKRVRERAPIPVDCATGAYVDTAPSYGPGDRICWELRIDFPGALDSGEPQLTDFLPPGVSYVPGSAQAIPGENTVAATLDDEGAGEGVLRWNLGGDVPSGETFAWRFATDVEQTVDDSLGDIQGNLMKLSYENTEEDTFPLRDEVEFVRSAALLNLTKGVRDVNDDPAGGNEPDVDGVAVAASDVVTFRVDVSNEGDLDAADGVVWDELEAGIDCEDVSEISHEGSCSGSSIEWTELSVPAEEAITLTYDVTIPAGVEPGRQFDDRAGVVSYTSATNTEEEFTYVPEENIDSEAAPANAPAADDDSSVHTAAVTLNKQATTAVSEGGNGEEQATIGERIDYTVQIVVPEGTTIYGSPVLTDDLGERQTYVEGTAEATRNGEALPGEFSLEDTGNVVSLQFPESYENAAGSGDDTFVVTFSATVADVAANTRTSPGHQLPNTAIFSWEYGDGEPQEEQDEATTTIVEPDVAVAKVDDDEDGVVSPGDTVEYTITASNSEAARVSTAHDLQLVDVVPAGLAPVLPIAEGGEWDEGSRTITWDIASMGPGAQQQRSYSAEVVEPATAGEVFTNEVELTATSMEGPDAGERGPGSPVEAGYVAEAEDTLRLGDATLTKEVSPGSATIGEQVTYTTEAVFPANVTYDDATVIDTLRDGLVYDETVEVGCSECTPPAVVELGEEPGAEDSTTIGWFLGDLPAQETARTYEITYTAHVANEYADESEVADEDTLVNTAAAFYNGSNEIEGTPESIPDPETFDSGTGPDEASVEVVEPQIAIDKRVSGDGDEDDTRPTEPGDAYTYSLTVTNTGSSPAYDVEVTDTPDIEKLDEIEALASGEATITDPDASDGELGWTIAGPIDPEGSVTVQYTAELAPSEDLEEGDAVQNTATVERFWGVAKAERDANPEGDYRSYTGPQDSVTLTVHLPQLEVEKTTGAETESEVAEVGEPFSWRLQLTNQSTYATAHDVELQDVLPPNWTYIAGSAVLSPGGEVDPDVSTAPTGDTLTWEVGDLEAEDQVVVSFEARPTVAAVDDPGSGESSPNVNEAQASGVDSGGASASAEGPYADEDEAQAVLTLPELTIEKTPDGETVNAGEEAGYEIEVANEAEVPAREVAVTDVLGAGQSYTPGSAEATPATGFSETAVSEDPESGETTIEWQIAEIGTETAVTIELPVATDPALGGDATLGNEASVVSREITSPESDEGSLEVDVDADLAILKEAQGAAVNAGEEMDFELTVTNEGPSDATKVEVEDALPANLQFVSADPPCEDREGTVVCEIGTLAPEASVSLTVRVIVDPDETDEVENTATVGAESPDSNPDNDESTATKPVAVEANLVVDKRGPEAPVLQGSSFDYTIVVENAGVSAAVDTTLEDPLPPEVTFEEASGDGSCEETGGTLECSFGTLEPGEQVEITLRVTADEVGTPTNVATASTPSPETTTADNEDDAPVEILPSADLAVSKSAPASVGAGEELPYLLEVVNNGPSDATGVTLTDTLPAGVEVVSADPACSHAGGVVTCTVAGQLDVSESRSYALTVDVPYALGGSTLTNSVTVGGNEGDLVTENDSAQAVTEVGPAADLAISKTAGGATAGSTASWTITVENRGPSATPATVTDTLPDGTSLSSANPSQGDCEAQGEELTCELGTLAAGASAQVGVVADVAADAAGKQLRNRATVEGPYPDPDPSNNEAETESEAAEPESSGLDLTLTKTASSARPRLGKAFGYLLLVRNVGDADATQVRVTDTPSKALRVKRAVPTNGRCSTRGAAIRCSLGTIPAGGRAAVKLVVVPTSPGRLRNTASVSSSGPADVNPGNNAGVAGVRVVAPRAPWSLAKRASRRVVRGGQKVRFALVVRVGRRAVAGARVCDALPRGLVFVRAPGASFRKGRACWKLGDLPARSRPVLRVVVRAERGFRPRRVRNVAVAAAGNAQRRAARAGVRIRPAFGGAPGGVTG